MTDLDDLRVFERVASRWSLSQAARDLGMPKSTVSRNVSRLEEALGVRLFQRTTRTVLPTPAGEALLQRCRGAIADLEEAIEAVGGYGGEPRGLVTVSCGIGFAINVLSRELPAFLDRYPQVELALDLSSREADLVAERVDVAIRFGPLPDSALVSSRLGRLPRYLCAAPVYLERYGEPREPADLDAHRCIEMPTREGRSRMWTFRRGPQSLSVDVRTRVGVNDAISIHELVRGAAGIGIVSGYLCGPDFSNGRLVRLLPEWSLDPVDVTVLYPSRRELSASVRAFVDFLRDVSVPGKGWQADIA